MKTQEKERIKEMVRAILESPHLPFRGKIKVGLQIRRTNLATIARRLKVTSDYVYHVVHYRDKSWEAGAMRVRNAVARALWTTPDKLWPRGN